MRMIVQLPSGTSQERRPSDVILLVIFIIRFSGTQTESGNWVVVVRSLTRQTAPLFPSYWCIVGSPESIMPLIFNVGFHLAASRSSDPGSEPSLSYINL